LYADPLDAPRYGDDDDKTHLDTIVDDAGEQAGEYIEQEELRTAVRAAVGRMKHDAARRTIEAYYFEGENTEQQASVAGVTPAEISNRLHRGYRELYHDPELRQWAVDYEYTNIYRHKGVRAFKSSFSSVVEDIVLQAEEVALQAEERQNKRAALADVLGSLV
jgi:hypothetical protein